MNQNFDPSYSWKKNEDWKQRYSKLYSYRNFGLPKSDESYRISFLHDSSPHVRALPRTKRPELAAELSSSDTNISTTIVSPRSEEYGSCSQKDDLGRNGTLLLEMVRARQREIADENVLDKTLDLPKEDTDEEDTPSESCAHGLNMRMTDRSISRSRVSRMSTRRDMDIPSILAYATNISTPVLLEIPAFQKVNAKSQQEEIPRWSIRRSVCPVCSQKWKDRSSIKKVKNSGLKRNPSSELPSVMAPAKLRTSITLAYVPRPALASVDEEAGISNGGLKNTSAAWQLTRARRIRIPKPAKPSPEVAVPPSSTAPLAGKELDQRVSRFLRDKTEQLEQSKSNVQLDPCPGLAYQFSIQ